MKVTFSDQQDATEARVQTAALCYRVTTRGKTEVLLITSRETGRWVLPKGWPMAGKTAQEAAAREAYEEAGVEGEVAGHCLGFYSYRKLLADGVEQPCVVSVFPLRVRRLVTRFPERGQRRLKWFAARKAALKVAEPDLAELLAGFDAVPVAAPKA